VCILLWYRLLSVGVLQRKLYWSQWRHSDGECSLWSNASRQVCYWLRQIGMLHRRAVVHGSSLLGTTLLPRLRRWSSTTSRWRLPQWSHVLPRSKVHLCHGYDTPGYPDGQFGKVAYKEDNLYGLVVDNLHSPTSGSNVQLNKINQY